VGVGSKALAPMNDLERALKHLNKLVENGLLDAINKRSEEYELSETEMAVVTQHVGEQPYFPPMRNRSKPIKRTPSPTPWPRFTDGCGLRSSPDSAARVLRGLSRGNVRSGSSRRSGAVTKAFGGRYWDRTSDLFGVNEEVTSMRFIYLCWSGAVFW
jgi:hypothetical protein